MPHPPYLQTEKVLQRAVTHGKRSCFPCFSQRRLPYRQTYTNTHTHTLAPATLTPQTFAPSARPSFSRLSGPNSTDNIDHWRGVGCSLVATDILRESRGWVPAVLGSCSSSSSGESAGAVRRRVHVNPGVGSGFVGVSVWVCVCASVFKMACWFAFCSILWCDGCATRGYVSKTNEFEFLNCVLGQGRASWSRGNGGGELFLFLFWFGVCAGFLNCFVWCRGNLGLKNVCDYSGRFV